MNQALMSQSITVLDRQQCNRQWSNQTSEHHSEHISSKHKELFEYLLKWILIPCSIGTKHTLHKRFRYSLNDARLVSFECFMTATTSFRHNLSASSCTETCWETRQTESRDALKVQLLGYFNNGVKRSGRRGGEGNTGLLWRAQMNDIFI